VKACITDDTRWCRQDAGYRRRKRKRKRRRRRRRKMLLRE